MKNTRQLQNCMQEIATVMAPLQEQLKSNRKFVHTLLHIFSAVSDFRYRGKIKYELENILCICLLLAMRGKFTSFYNAAIFIKVRAPYFRKLQLIEGNNIPSHDTLRRIFMYLDADELRDVMLSKIKSIIYKITKPSANEAKVKLLCGDGKTFNGSGRKHSKHNINVFNLLDASASVCLAAEPLVDKDSEIPVFQRLLSLYKLKGTIVTADALHCQRKTLEIITVRGGLYAMHVKDNQAELKQHIIDVLRLKRDKCKSFFFNDCEYTIFILDYVAQEADFPGAKAFIHMCSHKRKAQADYAPDEHYFISSSDNAQLIMEALDNRWCIEGDLHWWKDTFLKEDSCTFTDKNAVKVMATFNNITYALYKLASAIFDDSCMAETRIRFEECPEQMLAKLVPLMEKQNLTTLLKQNLRGRKKGNATTSQS